MAFSSGFSAEEYGSRNSSDVRIVESFGDCGEFAEVSDSGPSSSSVPFSAETLQVVLPHQQQQQQQQQQQDSLIGNELKIAGAVKRNPFVTGYDPSSPEEMAKRQQRAERFGIPLFYHGMEMDISEEGDAGEAAAAAFDPVQRAEEKLKRAEKFGVVDFEIDVDGPEREHYMMDLTSARRFDTVLLYGSKLALDNVSSRHIMEYYGIYGARHVEWLSAVRCNVVFADAGGARRAMMNTSSPLIRRTQMDEALNAQLQALGAAPHDIEFLAWRVCQSHRANSSLLCRVATAMDVKAPLEERRKSKYYSIYWKQNLDELMRRKQSQAEKTRLKVISLKELREQRGLPATPSMDDEEDQGFGVTFDESVVRGPDDTHDDDDDDSEFARDTSGPIRPKARGRGQARAFSAINQSSKPRVVLNSRR